MTEPRTEYRAVYRMPWYFGAPAELRDQGYVEYESDYAEDKETVKRQNYDLRSTEESHATIIRWEKRQVIIGDWRTDD